VFELTVLEKMKVLASVTYNHKIQVNNIKNTAYSAYFKVPVIIRFFSLLAFSQSFFVTFFDGSNVSNIGFRYFFPIESTKSRVSSGITYMKTDGGSGRSRKYRKETP